MTKIIWIDLDEVLSETIDQILEDNNFFLWNTRVKREDILDYYIYRNKNIDLSLEEAVKLFHWVYINDEGLKIKVVDWSYDKIKEFKNKGYILKIVTWRPEDIENYTKNWINKYFKDTFHSVHFANHFNYSWNEKKIRVKSEICNELWISTMIEDNFDYALELAQNWIYTFLLEKPWNKHITIEHPNIKKVKFWEEIII